MGFAAATASNDSLPPAGPPAYEVRLDLYQGPLDLLLHLIEQQQMDITAVSLAQVTDQYLSFLTALDTIDADALSDFLVVAAKLLLIKSQALLPKPPPIDLDDDSVEDVGDQLARQLVVYREFKAIAQMLSDREASRLRSYVRVSSSAVIEPRLEAGEISVLDLLAAARAALAIRPPDPVVDEVVSPVVVTIGERIALIQDWLTRRSRLLFSDLIKDCPSRTEVIVTLMAVLEMIKQNRVDVSQDVLFGDFVVFERTTSSVPSAVG